MNYSIVQPPTAPFSEDYKKLLQAVNGPIQIPNPTFASVSISPHLTCSICYQVFHKPRRLYCGHTFCKACLEQIFKGTTVGGSLNAGDAICPLCRQLIDKQKIGDDMIAQGVISQLQVFCPNQECTWQGTYAQLPQHYRIKCIFRDKQQRLPWMELFPQYAPKQPQQKQVNISQKGSLLSRIYAKSPQLQQKSSFKQLKAEFSSDNKSLQLRRQKVRQQRQKKQLQSKIVQREKQIDNIMTDKVDPEEMNRRKIRQEQKRKQRQLKRLKNKQQLKTLLAGNAQQIKQKEVFKERQYARSTMVRTNQNQKMDYLKKIFKKKENEDEERSSYTVQQINKLNTIPDLVIPKEIPLSKVIMQQEQIDGEPSYLVKNRLYQASYQKHRLVRKPYVQPANYGQMPKNIPHRHYSNPNQFSDNLSQRLHNFYFFLVCLPKQSCMLLYPITYHFFYLFYQKLVQLTIQLSVLALLSLILTYYLFIIYLLYIHICLLYHSFILIFILHWRSYLWLKKIGLLS